VTLQEYSEYFVRESVSKADKQKASLKFQ